MQANVSRDKLREDYQKACEEFIEAQKEHWKKSIGYIPFDEYFIYGFKKAIENINRKENYNSEKTK